jgi:hypothetical protein
MDLQLETLGVSGRRLGAGVPECPENDGTWSRNELSDETITCSPSWDNTNAVRDTATVSENHYYQLREK